MKKKPPSLEISVARKKLTTMDDRLAKEQVVYVTRHNKKAFAMVSLDFLQKALETLNILKNPAAMQMMEMMKAYHSIQDMPLPDEA